MGAQTAGEEAVAVGVLKNVAAVHATGHEGPDHDLAPDVQIRLRVRDYDRLAGGSGRGVEPNDLLHRAGEQAEGVRVAQVRLDREGHLGEIFERPDRSRRQAALVHSLTKERDAIVYARHDRLQSLQLQRDQLLAGHEVRRTDRVKPTGRVVPATHDGLLVQTHGPNSAARDGASA